MFELDNKIWIDKIDFINQSLYSFKYSLHGGRVYLYGFSVVPSCSHFPRGASRTFFYSRRIHRQRWMEANDVLNLTVSRSRKWNLKFPWRRSTEFAKQLRLFKGHKRVVSTLTISQRERKTGKMLKFAHNILDTEIEKMANTKLRFSFIRIDGIVDTYRWLFT